VLQWWGEAVWMPYRGRLLVPSTGETKEVVGLCIWGWCGGDDEEGSEKRKGERRWGVVGHIAEGSWRGRSQKKGVGSVEE